MNLGLVPEEQRFTQVRFLLSLCYFYFFFPHHDHCNLTPSMLLVRDVMSAVPRQKDVIWDNLLLLIEHRPTRVSGTTHEFQIALKILTKEYFDEQKPAEPALLPESKDSVPIAAI